MARSAGSREGDPELSRRLRALPSVEELAARLEGVPHEIAVAAAREAIAERRALLRDGTSAGAKGREDPASGGPPLIDALEHDARARAERALGPSLRNVVNATGVIVHTNLGRAPLAAPAREAAARAASGYSNLELDLGTGRRGSRQAHLEGLLRELTGAEAALVVNNCAAATLLAVTALARDRETVVSRGQLVEIGGAFRVPDVIGASGARLVEVGTTNRTRRRDYEAALGERTGAILRVHPSNFRTLGFVEEVRIEELCELGRGAGVPVIDDVGSGALAERLPELADEPPVRRSVAAGCGVVCFSGDKLLGGPQAGLMVGERAAIERCRSHPLARAVRIDKLSLAALEATLRLYRDPAAAVAELPVLRMLTAGEQELSGRAESMRSALAEAGVDARVIRVSGRVGGGALPLLELEGPACAVDPGPLSLDDLAERLRGGDHPVIGRAHEGWLLLDPRTLDDGEARTAIEAVIAALRSG